MKKWLIILGMITCMMGLTACGAEDQHEADIMAPEYAQKLVIDYIDMLNDPQAEEGYRRMADYGITEAALYNSAFESWNSAMEEIGGFKDITGITENTLEVMYSDNGMPVVMEGTIVVGLEGNERTASLEIIYERGSVTSITANTDYTFGENMQKAGLNTLLGMGTVFVVLILISLIISAFGLIPKIQAKFSKKNGTVAVKTAAVDSTIAQIIEKEELSDDLELVAVIAAAIAASEGAVSTDGFVVRSIRRAGNKWQAAGRAGV